nr:MAG TPA: hypothetical protein [Caudoviricetes sp.]
MIKCGQNRVTLRTNIFRIMMKKEELIKQCRYYKGEKEFPDNLESEVFGFWIGEKDFVENYGQDTEELLRLIENVGLMNFKSAWEGKASDELIAHLFCYLTKSRDCGDEYVIKGFVQRSLPLYFGSTSI